MLNRLCTKCKQEKDISLFHKALRRKSGVQTCCIDCASVKKKLWYTKNKEKSNTSSSEYAKENKVKLLSKRYTIPQELIQKKLDESNGKCNICQKETTLHLDHCHITGHIRGFLCIGCNLGLGKLGDDIESLERALEYLKKEKNNPSYCDIKCDKMSQ